jgi:hypothetical protein
MARVIVGKEIYGNSSNWENRILNDVRFGFTFLNSTNVIPHLTRRLREGKDLEFINKATDLARDFDPREMTAERLILEIFKDTKIYLKEESLMKIFKLVDFENGNKRGSFEIHNNLEFYKYFIFDGKVQETENLEKQNLQKNENVEILNLKEFPRQIDESDEELKFEDFENFEILDGENIPETIDGVKPNFQIKKRGVLKGKIRVPMGSFELNPRYSSLRKV